VAFERWSARAVGENKGRRRGIADGLGPCLRRRELKSSENSEEKCRQRRCEEEAKQGEGGIK